QNQQWTDGAFALPITLQEAWAPPTERQQNLDKAGGSEMFLAAMEADSPGLLVKSLDENCYRPQAAATQPTFMPSQSAGFAADSPGF
ncbi:hypothetical protein, partial [Leptothrix ochracea]